MDEHWGPMSDRIDVLAVVAGRGDGTPDNWMAAGNPVADCETGNCC